MTQAPPLHLVDAPGLWPWKTLAMVAALKEAPAGAVPAVAMLREARPTYGLVAFLRSTDTPWIRPTEDGHGLENAFGTPASGTAPLQRPFLATNGSVLHPPDNSARIGRYTAQILQLFNVQPARVGDAEPLSGAWDVNDITRRSQAHMPWFSLVFSGPDVTGLLSVARTASGVMESFDALVTSDKTRSDVWLDRVVDQAVALGSTAFAVDRHFGADHAGVHAGGDQYRVPLATVLGPAVAKDLVRHNLEVPGVRTEVRGNSPLQHLTLKFPNSTSWDGGAGQELRRSIFRPS